MSVVSTAPNAQQDEVPIIMFRDGQYYSVRGVTKVLSVSRQRVHALIKDKKISVKEYDGEFYIPVPEVNARWKAKHGAAADSEPND